MFQHHSRLAEGIRIESEMVSYSQEVYDPAKGEETSAIWSHYKIEVVICIFI